MAETPADIQAVCRLCLFGRKDALKSIFAGELGPNKLPQKILHLILIQVTRNDKLPTMVCNDCIIRLDTWYSYKKQCHRNQAKLAEWLNKTTGQNVLDAGIHIKSEPLDIDTSRHGPLTFKMEYPVNPDMMEVEFNEFDDEFRHPPFPQNSDHVYLEDLQRAGLEESEATSLKCPECGKAFGSVQNRRRHQNMQHRKDKRAQMMEIKKPPPELPIEPPDESQPDSNSEQTIENTVESSGNTSDETSKQATGKSTESTEQNSKQVNVTAEFTSEQAIVSNGEQNSDAGVGEKNLTAENINDTDMDTPSLETSATETSKEGLTETPNETKLEKSQEEDNINDNDEEMPGNMEDAKSKEEPTENQEKSFEGTETLKENSLEEKSTDEKPDVSEDNDQQKIEFAAGLKLVQKDSTHIEFEPLSKTELSYIEKCKAMVSMFHSLQCACHNVQHKSLRHLLSHLREIRVWFPLFTCYSCMISFTDRSTFTRHHCRCPKSQLETLIKLSNLRKRSEIKTRLYQNYKCNRCKFLYSFHEDFCKHINEDHDPGAPPIYCSCRTVFESVDEYKTHCHTSCVLSYYCDICFITTVTVDEFVKHCQEVHDSSEGFVLLQADCYTPRANYSFRKEVDEEHVVEGKRERRKSAKEPIMVHVYDNEIPPDLKDIPTRLVRQLVKLDFTPSTASEWNKSPTKCPLCQKEYSSVNNMVRHYRSHIEKQEVEIPFPLDDGEGENEDLYSCPECGGMYPASKWKKHIEDKHQPVSCTECDKVFQFQSELEQHRSVHLNLKVYRDSKTHSYRTAVISPGAETNGIVGGVMVMCEICDTMFKSKEELKHHKLTQHDSSNMSRASSSVDNFEEENSNIKDERAVDSKSAVTDYSLEGKLPCDYCGNLYASAKSLRDHVMNKHGADFIKKSEYPKKCEYCDKVCTTGAGLALHTQVHERYSPDKKSEFPKKCEYCDKICTTGAGLYLHTQMHERMTLGDVKKEKPVTSKTATIKSEVIKEIKKQENKEEEESYHTCKRCFKVFGTKGKLKDHMKSHGIHSSKPGPKSGLKKNRKIHCDLCHIAVENNSALMKHKSEEHSDELDGMPTLKNELEADEDLATTAVVYTCDICVETFDSKLELQEHKEIHDKPNITSKTRNALIYCKYCKIAFSSINELTKHMHVEHGESAKPKVTKEKSGQNSEKSFKCSICSKGFATHGAMTAHFGWHKRSGSTLEVSEQSENTPRAGVEVKMAKKAKLLKKVAQAAVNKQEPIDPPEFQCTTCFMELPNETALQIHVLEKHRGLDSLMLIPRCDTCNQDFVTQDEYETHKRFHDFLSRQKKHEKQLKGKQTPTQDLIQTPIIQSVQSVADSPHGSPKRHQCSWCPSVFSRSDTLNTHIKQNHKEHVKTEFECTQCDRVFEKQNSLTIHLKVHEKQKNAATVSATLVGGSGSKVYSCSICSKGFSFPKDLRMHTINAHPF